MQLDEDDFDPLADVPADALDEAPAEHRPTGKRLHRSEAEFKDLVGRLHVTPRLAAAGLVVLVAVVVAVLWVSHLPRDIEQTTDFRWGWVGAAVVIVQLMSLGYAVSLAAAAKWHPPFGRTVQLEFAEALTLVMTPMGAGSLTLSVRFLTRTGLGTTESAGATGLSSFLTTVVSTISLPIAGALAASTLDVASLKQEVPSGLWEVLLAVVVVAVGVTVAVRAPSLRAKAANWLRGTAHYVRTVVEHPATGAAVAGGQLIVMAGQVGCAAFLLKAVGAPVNLAALVVITQLSSAASSVVPVPGGLGAPEAILIAGFTSIGIEHNSAIVVGLTYRMLTYWVPMLPGAGLLYDLFRRGYV